MIRLKDLLNESWKDQFQSMKVYDNPFHRAFKPMNEDNPNGDKMLTQKVINKLKERRNKSKSSSQRRKYSALIEKLERNYEEGNFLKEVKSLYEVIKETVFQRKDMPQVKTDDLGKAIKKLKRMGIDVKRGNIEPGQLEPSQKDIYDDKVKKILTRTTKGSLRTMKPLVISRDNYIVDGHHRWKALLIGFPTEKIPYIKVGLPMKRAIQIYNKVASEI